MITNMDEEITKDERINTLKALCDILSLPIEPIPLKEIDLSKRIAVMDPATVCLIEAKTDAAKYILIQFVDKSDVPELKLDFIQPKDIFTCKYSSDYLTKIITLMNATPNEKIFIHIGNEYPLMVENEHFKVILAPRVDN